MEERRTKEALAQMLDVLERENEALRTGHHSVIGELAQEKDQLRQELERLQDGQAQMALDLRSLGREVKSLAELNQMLIGQMNQHFTGMLTMMMRLSGDTQTYAANGYMTSPTRATMRRKEIIA